MELANCACHYGLARNTALNCYSLDKKPDSDLFIYIAIKWYSSKEFFEIMINSEASKYFTWGIGTF